jgi:hypothetical protein
VGTPQSWYFGKQVAAKVSTPHGYFKCPNTPGLWKHATCPISFTLVVDSFRVKYVGKEHVNHLIKCIKTKYELTKDWPGDLYCGIKLNWDYTAGTFDISMPGYITKLLHKYKHRVPSKPQCCPYSPAPKQYGAQAQAPLPVEISPKLLPDDVNSLSAMDGHDRPLLN